MRISDWSSDVCSSDLADDAVGFFHGQAEVIGERGGDRRPVDADAVGNETRAVLAVDHFLAELDVAEAAERIDGRGLGLRALHQFEQPRSEEHTSELQSLMRISYAVFCSKKKNKK